MRIKGLFGQTQKNEKNTTDHDIDKQIKRINALEVQLGRLVKLENSNRNQKNEEDIKNSYVTREPPQNQYKFGQLQNKLGKLEQVIEQIKGEINSRDSQYITSIKSLEDRINDSLKMKVVEEGKAYFDFNEAELNLDTLKSSLINSVTTNVTEVINHYVEQKFLFIESNISLINELQLEINKRLNNLERKFSEYLESQEKKQPSILREITIEKFYLDKYEQNNNIAQLGIKELSGALNIGATYGTGVIPEELTEQMKSEMEELHSAKKDYEENKNTNINDESSSENSGNPEVNNDFNEVNIED